MQDIKATLYPCAHCTGTGTCKNGSANSSCNVCIKDNELKGKEHIGLACGICGGLGLAEPKTERINKRITPLLALTIVFLLLSGVFFSAITNNPHFNEILAFSGTLIGTVLGFYFSARSKSG